jgi:hypothetical protein
MGSRASFPGDKAAGAWSWSLTYSQCRVKENVDLYIHSPILFRGVVLNKDNFTFFYFLPINTESRDSSVGMATGYGLDDQEGREFESR